jgi:hypothetical protein
MFGKECLLRELAETKGLHLSMPFTLGGHKYAIRRIKDGRSTISYAFSSDDLNEIARFIVETPVCQETVSRQVSKHRGLCEEIVLAGASEEPLPCVLNTVVSEKLTDNLGSELPPPFAPSEGVVIRSGRHPFSAEDGSGSDSPTYPVKHPKGGDIH